MHETCDWRETFCGREAELKRLIGAYDAVEQGSGPRLAVVCADRGMGKTRLVQEFYRFLTTERDPGNYWPDASLFKGNNLRVAPDFSDPKIQAHFSSFTNAERPMPFLWWGLRLHDPTDRNAVRSDMAGHRRSLDPHLERVCQERDLATKRARASQAAKDVAKDVVLKIGEGLLDSIPGVSLGKNLFEVGVGVLKTAKRQSKLRSQERQFAKTNLAQLEEARAQDIYETTLADLSAVLEPWDGVARVPVIVFVDDAQFARADGDEGALRFLAQLWQQAEKKRWPLLLVATHWAVDWDQDRLAGTPSFAGTFHEVASDEARGAMVFLSKQADLRALAKSGLPNMPAEDVGLVLRKADGNPQVLMELIGRVHASPAWSARDGGLSSLGRRKIEEHSCDLTQLIYERLVSDATPPEVRLAVALSSLQGMQFLCPLTEAAANALRLGSVGTGIAEAAQPFRLIVGVDAGVASFVQRAYRDAAGALVESHLGDPQVIKDGVLEAAIAVASSEQSRNALTPRQHRALLGVVASLGAESEDREQRTEAARSLLRLVELEEDGAARAQHARTFARGLGRLWNAIGFSDEQIQTARAALEQWDGAHSSYAIDRRLLDELRQAHRADPADHLLRLIHALYLMYIHESWLGEYDRAAQLVTEFVELSRTAVSSGVLTEADLAENLLLAATSWLGIIPDELASSRCEEALAILRKRFRNELNVETCASLVEGLSDVSEQRGTSGDSCGAEALLREAVEAARVLYAQPAAQEARQLAAKLCVAALVDYLSPKVLSADSRFRLAPGEGAGELMPYFVELNNVVSELDSASLDTLAEALVVYAMFAALVAVRMRNSALATTFFGRCHELADAPNVRPSTRAFALCSAALEALTQQDLDASKGFAEEAVRVSRDSRCWKLHHQMLAFEAYLKRVDLAALLEPDPEDADIAAAMLPALKSIRESMAIDGISDGAAIEVLALIKDWLSDDKLRSLDATTVHSIVSEVQLLSAELRKHPESQLLMTKGGVDWLLAVLSALTLGARFSPTSNLDSLWEFSPVLLRSVREFNHDIECLNDIARALSFLGTWSSLASPHGGAVSLTRELVERSDDPLYRRYLCLRLGALACTHVSNGSELERARELLGEALAISSELVSQTESVDNLGALEMVLHDLERLSRASGEVNEAYGYRSRRIDVLRKVVLLSNGGEGRETLSELLGEPDGDVANAALLH